MFDLMNYDYDIRKTLNDIIGEENAFNSISDGLNDKEILRLAVEYLRDATDRLDGDLDNKEVLVEYDKLRGIIGQLEDIIQHYV